MSLEPGMGAAWWQRSSVLSALLFLSLATNLFFAGWLLGGQSVRGHFGPPISIEHFDDQIRTTLSPDGARIMQTAFGTIRSRFAVHSADARAVRERLMETLKSEPFSSTDYIAASNKARAERDNDRAEADEEIAKAIAQLSLDDRRRLVDIRQQTGPGNVFGHFR
jgi:uncharacterized membrane protein